MKNAKCRKSIIPGWTAVEQGQNSAQTMTGLESARRGIHLAANSVALSRRNRADLSQKPVDCFGLLLVIQSTDSPKSSSLELQRVLTVDCLNCLIQIQSTTYSSRLPKFHVGKLVDCFDLLECYRAPESFDCRLVSSSGRLLPLHLTFQPSNTQPVDYSVSLWENQSTGCSGHQTWLFPKSLFHIYGDTCHTYLRSNALVLHIIYHICIT